MISLIPHFPSPRKHARKFAEQTNIVGLKLCGIIQSRGQSNCLFFYKRIVFQDSKNFSKDYIRNPFDI